jgi:hypothetical protein
MEPVPASSLVFPLACPSCTANAGFAIMATPVRGLEVVKLDILCRACIHEWTLHVITSVPDEPPRQS